MTLPADITADQVQPDHKKLYTQAAHSVKWSILYNVVPRLVTPFSTIILAAILTPADFGLVAISTFVIALAQIVIDMGLGKALIRTTESLAECASIILWVSLSMAGLLCAAIWIFAPGIAALYHNPQVTNIIRLASFSLILTSTMVVPKALMRRNMEFDRLFWVYSSFLISQAIFSVILALLGCGAWSVIGGQLLGISVSIWFAWKGEPWRPVPVQNWGLLISMLKFSLWVMVSGFQEWLFTYADNVIAGIFLSIQGLGVYALGYNIATIIPSFLAASLSDVAYPTFCKIQGEVQEVGKSLLGLQRLTSTLLFPIVFGLAAIATPAISLLYADKWPNLAQVVGILVFMPGLGSLWNLNDSAYQAIGKPGLSARISGLNLLILIPLLWLAAPQGLLIFTLARFAGAWLRPLGNILWGFRFLGVSLKEQILALSQPLAMSLVMFALISFLTHQVGIFAGLSGWLKLAGIILSGAAVYFFQLWAWNRALWNQLLASLRRILATP